jgi:hypothetical protein
MKAQHAIHSGDALGPVARALIFSGTVLGPGVVSVELPLAASDPEEPLPPVDPPPKADRGQAATPPPRRSA